MKPVTPFLPVDGILIVDKPQGWTSHDVCAFVKKKFRVKKVGHAGTLDPLATGLLVLLLGAATKQSAFLSANDKEYEGFMQLGQKTDSHDRLGKITGEASWENVTLEKIREKVREFTGEIIQIPPMVSALKQQGVRLYELSRRGITVPREGRRITVYHFAVRSQEGNKVYFCVRVSKGTYVRTLINDLGEALGCFATLAELKRIQSGEFSIADSITVDQLKEMTPAEFTLKVRRLSSLSHAGL